MPAVKRYDITAASHPESGGWLTAEESPSGEWVKFEDVAKLLAELTAAREELHEWEQSAIERSERDR